MIKNMKSRLTKLKKRTKKLESISYGKLDIIWFWKWLKLAIDLEGTTISFTKSNWEETTRKGRYDEKLKVLSVRKRVKRTKSFTIKVGGNGLSKIDLNELRRMKKIRNMSDKEVKTYSEKWFQKNKHLFEDYNVLFVDDKNKMIDSDEYFTVQIHKSLNRRTIDNQIDTFRKGLKLKSQEGSKRAITFIRGVQRDVMQRQWDVFDYKTTNDKNKMHKEGRRYWSYEIARKVGFNTSIGKQTYGTYKIKGGKTQRIGNRSVEKAYESARCILVNISNGIFVKSTL